MNQQDLEAALRKRSYDTRTRHELGAMEFDGKPFVFWSRKFNVADADKYGKRLEAGELKAIVEMFVEKAETEDGNRMFDGSMVKTLMETLEVDAINEIAEAISGGSLATVEAAEGNSSGIPPVG